MPAQYPNKITDAHVDYKGRLWLTFRTGPREYFTFRADDLQFEVTEEFSPHPSMSGDRREPGTISFTINKEPTVSPNRPRRRKEV